MNKKIYGISGSTLKLIAMLLMLIDHITGLLLYKFPLFTNTIFSLLGKDISLYYILRLIGRISFPLFCFLLVEGFIHTRDRKKYGVRLFIFALLSELPWNFAHSGNLFHSTQNVMFTLLCGYLALCALEYFEKQYLRQLVSLLILFIICSFCKVDYGVRGLGLIMIIYLLREKPVPQAIAGSCMLNTGWAAGFAFIPINLYNGERGFMRGTTWKYIGYLFYPVHLLMLGLLRHFVFT